MSESVLEQCFGPVVTGSPLHKQMRGNFSWTLTLHHLIMALKVSIGQKLEAEL
jgi:hypothetical protein